MSSLRSQKPAGAATGLSLLPVTPCFAYDIDVVLSAGEVSLLVATGLHVHAAAACARADAARDGLDHGPPNFSGVRALPARPCGLRAPLDAGDVSVIKPAACLECMPTVVLTSRPGMQCVHSRLCSVAMLQQTHCIQASQSLGMVPKATRPPFRRFARHAHVGCAAASASATRGARFERPHQLRDGGHRPVDLSQHVVPSRRGPLLRGDARGGGACNADGTAARAGTQHSFIPRRQTPSCMWRPSTAGDVVRGKKRSLT